MEDGARRKYENELGNHIYTVLQMLSFTTKYSGKNIITDTVFYLDEHWKSFKLNKRENLKRAGKRLLTI